MTLSGWNERRKRENKIAKRVEVRMVSDHPGVHKRLSASILLLGASALSPIAIIELVTFGVLPEKYLALMSYSGVPPFTLWGWLIVPSFIFYSVAAIQYIGKSKPIHEELKAAAQ